MTQNKPQPKKGKTKLGAASDAPPKKSMGFWGWLAVGAVAYAIAKKGK